MGRGFPPFCKWWDILLSGWPNFQLQPWPWLEKNFHLDSQLFITMSSSWKCDVGKVSPHLLPKVSTEGWEKIHLKSWSFMYHSLSWKFEPSQTWLSFFLADLGEFPPFSEKNEILLRGVKKIHRKSWSIIDLNFKQNLTFLPFCWYGGYPPFLPKMWNFAWGLEKISASTLVIYWPELFLRVWAKSGMIKIGAGKIFIFNLDHLLDWAFLESLSKVRHDWVF